MADISLPRRGSGSAGPQRGVQIPDTDQIQPVQGARDPGLAIRPGAFDPGGKGLEEFGAGLAKLGEGTQRAFDRQQKLFDANATAEAALAFDRLGMEEFRRIQTEDDPTRVEFIKDYEKWLVGERDPNTGMMILGGKAQSALDNLPKGVSEEAKNSLRTKLQASGSGMVDAAGQIALEAGQQKAVDLIDAQTNQLAAQAARDPDSYEAILLDGDEKLKSYAGALGPDRERDQEVKRRTAILEATVNARVNMGDFAGARRLVGDTRNDDVLAPDLRRTLTNSINAEDDRRAQRRVAEADRAERLADKRLKESQEAVEKDGWDMWRQGKLDQDWLTANRTNLSANQVEAFSRVLIGGDKINDRDAFADLQKSLHSDPQEAERMAYLYHKDGLINDGTLASTVEKARTFSRQEGPKSQYERSRDFIRGSLDPGPLVNDPIARERMEEALQLYDGYAGEKVRPDEELDAKARNIVERFRLFDLTRARFSLPVPYGASVAREAVDLSAVEAAEDRLASEFSANRIGRAEFNNESRYLKRWRDVLERERASKQQREPGQK